MSDFIIQIGDYVAPEHVSERLRSRPGMRERQIDVRRFVWGSAVIQSPPGRGYHPFERDGILVACTGRPRLLGVTHEDHGTDGFCRELAQALVRCEETELPGSITGMFAIAILQHAGFRVATDMLGSQPVYKAVDRKMRVICVGTNPDIVAEIAGCRSDIDLVSIGEFVVFDQITFPFTTYVGTSEVEPGSIHHWSINNGIVSETSHVYWQPKEPNKWPCRSEIANELELALRSAAEEISRGSNRLAVTLSGGRDSRTVLALMRDKGLEAALTYCTRENRETDVAAQVARAAGVRHMLVKRDPHFYGKVLERTVALIGSEVRGVAHGFAVVDAHLEDEFDVIVGGYLSDTLLKDHFMPQSVRERFRHKSIRERIATMLCSADSCHKPATRWATSAEILSPEVREQVNLRRRNRLARIAEVRPGSCEEWQGFWPISRQHDVGSALANNRLFCADELFYFRRVIEAAARISPVDRYSGTAAHLTFNRLCGPLIEMVNANTGIAASADIEAEGKFFKSLRRTGQLDGFRSLPPSDTPWNDVQHSWSDPVKLLLHSPDWRRYRDEVVNSDSFELLRSILSVEKREMIGNFSVGDDPRVGMALIQMGLHLKNSLPFQ